MSASSAGPPLPVLYFIPKSYVKSHIALSDWLAPMKSGGMTISLSPTIKVDIGVFGNFCYLYKKF